MAEETTVPETYDSYSYAEAGGRPELSPEPIDKRPIIFGAIAAVVVILIFVGVGFALFSYPEAAARLRDISIFFMCLGGIFIILLLIALIVIIAYLVLKVNDLIQLLNREIKPLLTNLQNTTHTVRGTATFLSDYAARPVISTVSTVSAVKAIINALFRR